MMHTISLSIEIYYVQPFSYKKVTDREADIFEFILLIGISTKTENYLLLLVSYWPLR